LSLSRRDDFCCFYHLELSRVRLPQVQLRRVLTRLPSPSRILESSLHCFARRQFSQPGRKFLPAKFLFLRLDCWKRCQPCDERSQR
jgi:hypothetical protein